MSPSLHIPLRAPLSVICLVALVKKAFPTGAGSPGRLQPAVCSPGIAIGPGTVVYYQNLTKPLTLEEQKPYRSCPGPFF